MHYIIFVNSRHIVSQFIIHFDVQRLILKLVQIPKELRECGSQQRNVTNVYKFINKMYFNKCKCNIHIYYVISFNVSGIKNGITF